MPAGRCEVEPELFAHVTHMLRGVAPLALVLEGGTNLSATSRAVEGCMRVLLGEAPPPLMDTSADRVGWVAVMNTLQVGVIGVLTVLFCVCGGVGVGVNMTACCCTS